MTTDDPALAAFVAEQHPRLVGALGLYTGDRDLAEELAAETLARIARDWSRLRHLDAPGPYVHRIAMNLATSWFRRRAAGRRAMARVGPDPTSSADVDTAEVLSVRAAVAALPDRQRAAVVLHHFVGLSTPEVAEVLGVGAGTVRSNLHDARGALRLLLDDELDEQLDAPTTQEARRG